MISGRFPMTREHTVLLSKVLNIHRIWYSKLIPSPKTTALTDMLRDLKASEHYDLIVIGSGPAGQKCAIDSAKHGKSVAIIDKNEMHGGVCVHTGTVPSKVRIDYISLLDEDRLHANPARLLERRYCI